jgi:hypothetical protein
MPLLKSVSSIGDGVCEDGAMVALDMASAKSDVRIKGNDQYTFGLSDLRAEVEGDARRAKNYWLLGRGRDEGSRPEAMAQSWIVYRAVKNGSDSNGGNRRKK